MSLNQPANGIDAVLVPIAGGLYDIQIDFAGDIQTADAFDTAILVSLLAARRADESQVPESNRRKGWIGNESTPGQEMGSTLWLYEQARVTRTALNGIEDAAREALQWLVDDGFAVRLSGITAAPTSSGVSLELTIERPSGETETRFFQLWNCTGVS